jgi:hypothetical protein
MKLVFCEDPLTVRIPDTEYQTEVDAVKRAGLDFILFNHETLTSDNNPKKAVKLVPKEPKLVQGLYRGWMLTPDQYTKLYTALLDKGIALVNNPAEYKHCHYLPDSYSVIESHTPKSVWLNMASDDVSIDNIMRILKPFGDKPLILKDFVKSLKHYWEEACFIPSASDTETVKRIVHKFMELQSEYLNEGLVFREFIEFEHIGTHSKSKMPLTKEFRIFVLDGKPIAINNYWDEGDYDGALPPIESFSKEMQNIKSHFFTMDVAKRKNGEWMIIELGDAQVAGLQGDINADDFYATFV